MQTLQQRGDELLKRARKAFESIGWIPHHIFSELRTAGFDAIWLERMWSLEHKA